MKEKTKIITLQEYIPRRKAREAMEKETKLVHGLSTVVDPAVNSSQEGTVLHYYSPRACYWV